jgi:subtilisin family serine protease
MFAKQLSLRVLTAMVAMLVIASSLYAGDGKLRRSTRPAKGQYIVILEPQGTDVDIPIQALTRMHGGEVTSVYRGAPWEGYAVRNLPEAAALALSRDPRVRVVEEDGLVELLQTQPANWGLDRTNQRYLPLDQSLSAGCQPTDMVYIYIMDSGINDPNGTQFGTRLIDGWKDPSFTTYRDENGYFGHGTAVATIAGGAAYGVATGAKIVNVKVISEENNTVSKAIRGIREYINVHDNGGRPKVVNMSLLYPSALYPANDLSALDSTILDSMNTHKITYVVGAGNGDANGEVDACVAGSPARKGQTNGIITVGATYLSSGYTVDRRVQVLFQSGYGPCVDIFAPGLKVQAMAKDGDPYLFSGTSAATPYVAGAAARRLAVHWSSYGTIKLPADVEAAVKGDATPNVIEASTIGAGSPNLLLYRFYMRCRS